MICRTEVHLITHQNANAVSHEHHCALQTPFTPDSTACTLPFVKFDLFLSFQHLHIYTFVITVTTCVLLKKDALKEMERL